MRGAITGLILSLFLPVSISRAASLSVRPDGMGDFPTIQAAVDYAAEGDTIVLSPGTFTGAGNVNVDSRSKGIMVKGAGAAATTIDCAWTSRAFRVHDNASSFFVISDMTMTRGWGGTGGAIQCVNAAVEVRDAIITRSIACWGQVLGCVDGQALIVRCRLLNDTCVVGAPCYGPGAPICEGLSYGGPVSALRSTLEMIDSYGEGNANESSQAQIVYALDSSVQLAGNRFCRNITFDGGPEAYFEQCDVSATANEFIENAAWTSGIHLVQCTGEVRGNLFDGNRVHVGPGGIQSENSSARLSFNLLRGNSGASIESNRSTGDITRNLIVGTQGSCCSDGIGTQVLGCELLRVENNTLYNNGVGSGYDHVGSEIDVPSSSAWVFRNMIVHDEFDRVVTCESGGCNVPPPPGLDPGNWLWGDGTIIDVANHGGFCLGGFEYSDPKHRDPANDNFFLRPNSTCDVDTIINTHVWKQFFGALPKGSRPSGLLNVSRPADAWPSGSQPGSSYVLNGFSISNTYRYDASINYRVTSPSGLLRDNGDPLSLVGATPVLAPGESFMPPPAALEVPASNRNVVVKYFFAYAPALNIVDTVQTMVHFASPVPVRVTSFRAAQQSAAVRLAWSTGFGVDVRGWHVYRAERDQPFERVTAGPLAASARSYTDARIVSGVPYRYRLVALDPDEMLAGEVRITPSIALALEQNTPNPFHSQTTIRFSMPGPARATLAVYAVDGTLVRTLLDGSVDDVGGEVTWDGLDANGRPASSGVYFCRLTVDSHSLTRKIVLAR